MAAEFDAAMNGSHPAATHGKARATLMSMKSR
jgi:hypothetical protein